MMIGRIRGANTILHAEGCTDLPVYKDDSQMVSAWYPTPAELKLLQAGQPIFLHIHGTQHPPVALTVPVDEY